MIFIEEIQLVKGLNDLGFGFIKRKKSLDDGVYITSIKKNGVADLDGRLQEGDEILEVNNTKLKKLSPVEITNLIKESSKNVILKVVHKNFSPNYYNYIATIFKIIVPIVLFLLIIFFIKFYF